MKRLLQLRVFRLGLLVDGDVGVGVFPEGEEIFVGGERSDAGGIGIRSLQGSRLQGVRPSHPQMRQGSGPTIPDDAAMVENLLKLGPRLRCPVRLPCARLREKKQDFARPKGPLRVSSERPLCCAQDRQ